MMRKIFLLGLAVVFSFMMTAQEKISEGIITAKQTMSSDNEQMQAQLDMMGEMVITVYFKGTKSRGELSNPMAGDVVAVSDSESMQTLTLMDNPMMGKKFMLKSNELTPEQLNNIKIEEGTTTKTILGYECKEYLVTVVQEGNELKMTMFVTDEIAPVVTQQTAMLGDKLKGFPMFITTNMSQQGMAMTMTYEVTKLEKADVSDDKFNMTPPEGYTEMTGM